MPNDTTTGDIDEFEEERDEELAEELKEHEHIMDVDDGIDEPFMIKSMGQIA